MVLTLVREPEDILLPLTSGEIVFPVGKLKSGAQQWMESTAAALRQLNGRFMSTTGSGCEMVHIPVHGLF